MAPSLASLLRRSMKISVRSRLAFTCLALAWGLAAPGLRAQRVMENLGRGVVAVKAAEDKIFVSWRLLGADPAAAQ